MTKVKITADAVMAVIDSILTDEDIDTIIADPSAPQEWKGKKINEALNVEYFAFKHRAVASEQLIAQKLQESFSANTLLGLDRSFCLVSIGETERIFSKDVDMAVVSATMEYWVQTEKIKLLEFLIEDCNIALSGIRIPVVFGNQTRQAVVIFSPLDVIDINTETVCGELATCVVHINLLLYPDVISYCDYKVSLSYIDTDENVKTSDIPLSSFSFVNSMTQKAVPGVKNVGSVGSINLSCAISFVLVFDGYNNDFINYITNKALVKSETISDNNQSYTMTVLRGGKTYVHDVVIKDHQVSVNSDTGNETHTLALVTRGI